ncbi:MAG: hypothetical protein LBU34_04530 [Planctomycetaceae bacterium]|jgi:hypothetical protein|nr:hypothetical protein [Planctomycetaceae bacterium]
MTTLTVNILNPEAHRLLKGLEDIGLIELDNRNALLVQTDENSISDVFGQWQSDQSAENIIRDIYESRTIGRKYESL